MSDCKIIPFPVKNVKRSSGKKLPARVVKKQKEPELTIDDLNNQFLFLAIGMIGFYHGKPISEIQKILYKEIVYHVKDYNIIEYFEKFINEEFITHVANLADRIRDTMNSPEDDE